MIQKDLSMPFSPAWTNTRTHLHGGKGPAIKPVKLVGMGNFHQPSIINAEVRHAPRFRNIPVTRAAIGGGEVRATLGTTVKPDAEINDSPHVARVLLPAVPLSAARQKRVRFRGDRNALKRLVRR